MTDVAHSIDIDLLIKLRDPEYRQKFFLAESSARIAAQLIALRKRRGLSQREVASLTGTRQPAISRAEQADYQNWSFNTLRSIADALDARIRVLIEPAEDILGEYDRESETENARSAEDKALERFLRQSDRTPRSPSPQERRIESARTILPEEGTQRRPMEQQLADERKLPDEHLGHLIGGSSNQQKETKLLGDQDAARGRWNW